MSLREQKVELISRLVQCKKERDMAINQLDQVVAAAAAAEKS